MAVVTTNVIERREYKYLIDGATAARLRAAIRPFCELDPHAARSPGGRYTIESLYLDSPHMGLYWANEHEQVDRIKVRVRGYADAPNSPVFFEVKRRINDVITKTRGRAPRDRWPELLEDPAAPIPDEVGGKDRPALERFLALTRTMHLRPYTLVRYDREPYFSTVDDYVRVTMDTRIRAQVMERASFSAPERGWRALDHGKMQRESLIVLELKFTTQVPLWLHNIVEQLDLTRRSFSKYGGSIKAFYGATDARTFRLAGGWR